MRVAIGSVRTQFVRNPSPSEVKQVSAQLLSLPLVSQQETALEAGSPSNVLWFRDDVALAKPVHAGLLFIVRSKKGSTYGLRYAAQLSRLARGSRRTACVGVWVIVPASFRHQRCLGAAGFAVDSFPAK